MSFFKKTQEKLAELRESQSEDNWAQRERQQIIAEAFNTESRPPRLVFEDEAQYFGGHPHFPDYNRNVKGTIYLTQDGICWVGYPIRLILPWTWITALTLTSHKSTSFTQEFIEGLNKGWGQENKVYNNVLVVDFVLENIPYQVFFYFTGGITRGISAEKAKAFVEKTVPFKRYFRGQGMQGPAPAPAKSELSAVEALERLATLRQGGHLSEEEYQKLKAKIISGL